MTGMTVTATQTGSTNSGTVLGVRVVTGAKSSASQPGQTGTQFAFTGTLAITPEAAGSWIFGSLWTSEGGGSISPFDSNTTFEAGSTFNPDGFVGALIRSTNTTTANTALILGSNTGSGVHQEIALAEILANTTLAEDSSTPAIVETETTSATSASFTPPGGALLVALVIANAGSVVEVTITDSLSLTWTQQAMISPSGFGLVGVWTADVPSTTPHDLDAGTGTDATGSIVILTPPGPGRFAAVQLGYGVRCTVPGCPGRGARQSPDCHCDSD